MDSSSSDEAIKKLIRRVSETPPVLAVRRPLRIGDRLAGARFHVLDELGKGGMGRVFAAYDEEISAEVALKMVGRMTPQAIVQLKREFRTASELSHPNIVRLHELFHEGMEWFFTMDLIRGESLTKVLSRVSVAERGGLIRLVTQQLASALQFVHDFGAIHGDIKPSNFLITGGPAQDGKPLRVVLLDFGLAQALGRTGGGGTLAYMAPEQLAGEPVTEATDWYSLGVVLHEALSGELPRPFQSPMLERAPRDLRFVCESLLERSPQNRPSGSMVLRMLQVPVVTAGSSSSSPPRPRLVGRGDEIAKFQALRANASTAAPSLVLVHGPSGVGKSALIEHLVQHERARGAIVLKGKCRENESIGYKAVDGIIDDLVNLLLEMSDPEARRILPESVADLVQLFPSLRTLSVISQVSINDVERQDQGLLRQRAIGAFVELLRNLSSFGPVVIWIDDLQWSDTESALILGPVLAMSGNPLPLLFIGSYRSDQSESTAVLDALYSERSLNLPEPIEIPLDVLSEIDAEHLARELLPDAPESIHYARAIVRDAAGLPLFITELAHLARTSSTLAGGDEPVTLSRIVAERVNRLTVEARHVLELIATAGAPVPRVTLKQAQRLRAPELDDAISSLRANRLILTNGLREEHTVDIRHDRLRELVSAMIEPARLRQHHLSLATILEARDGNADQVARHYENAGDLTRAARHWLVAAEKSAQALAFTKAADFYARALKRASLDAVERRRAMLRRAEMLAYAGEGEFAAEVFLAAAENCARDEAVELRRRAAEQLLLSGRIPEGMRVIDDVLVATRMPRSRSGKAAIPSLILGRLRLRVRGLHFRLRSEAELSREELVRLDAAWTIACSMGFVDYIRGADFQNRHLLLALRAGEPRRLGRALALEALNAAAPARGSRRRTELLLQISEGLVDKTPDRDSALGLLALARGVAAYLHSEIESAVTHCTEAVKILTSRCAGAVWERVTAQRFLIASLFHAGEFKQLSCIVPPLIAEADAMANLYARQFFRGGYSVAAWLVRDDVAEARRQLSLAGEEWRSESFQLPEYNRLIAQTYIDLYAGEYERAAATLREHWSTIEHTQLLRIAIVRVQLLHLRGLTAAAASLEAGRTAGAGASKLYRDEARKCAAALQRDRLQRAHPMGALIDAAVDVAEHKYAEASVKLREATKAFDAHGMQLFAAATRLRLGEIMGGDEGLAIVGSARARFSGQGVQSPEKMARMLAPGFETTHSLLPAGP